MATSDFLSNIFILFLQDGVSVTALLRSRDDLAPLVVITGSRTRPREAFVSVNNNLFQTNSLISAVDLAYKLTWERNINY